MKKCFLILEIDTNGDKPFVLPIGAFSRKGEAEMVLADRRRVKPKAERNQVLLIEVPEVDKMSAFKGI